jgi:hypothetical protein
MVGSRGEINDRTPLSRGPTGFGKSIMLAEDIITDNQAKEKGKLQNEPIFGTLKII